MVMKILVGPFPHYYAIVDDEDYEWLSDFNWTPTQSGIQQSVYAVNKNLGLMHKMITGNDRTDHKNRIGLDNRRENLRPCNQSQNQGNCTKSRSYSGNPTSSKFKGVTFDKRTGRWMSKVMCQGILYNLGRFTDEVEAAKAYDVKARELFGEFARLNFPEEG